MKNNKKLQTMVRDLTNSKDVVKSLVKLGTQNTTLNGNDFKEWKEDQGETFTWIKASRIVGLSVRRCTDLATFGEKAIPERVTKIIVLASCL